MFTNIYNISKKLILFSLALFILSGCLKRPHPQTGDFCGKVIDEYTHEPVPGVTLDIGGQNTTTDLDGKFSIAVLPPGDYQLILARDWYNSRTFDVHHIGKQDSLKFPLIPVPLEGKILYSGDGTGNREIYEIILEDQLRNHYAVTKLSNSSWPETNPVKLGDGRIIFQSKRNGSNDDLYIADSRNIDGTATLLSCNNIDCNDENPSVSYNCSEIKMVFKSGKKNSDGSTNGFIRLYNLTTDKSTDIKEGDQLITGFNPVINSDGTKIALVGGNYEKLLIFNVSGMSVTKSNEYNFSSIPQKLKINNPCWSHNGDYIAFEAYQNSDGPRSIYQISSQAGSASDLTPLTSAQGQQQHKHPCYSKDGTMLYFSANIIYSSRFDIYRVRVNSGWQENRSWVMVSSGSGSKDCPNWSWGQ
jgi:Tol biopolymer transport system component